MPYADPADLALLPADAWGVICRLAFVCNDNTGELLIPSSFRGVAAHLDIGRNRLSRLLTVILEWQIKTGWRYLTVADDGQTSIIRLVVKGKKIGIKGGDDDR